MASIIPFVSAAYSERLSRRHESSLPDIWNLLDQVKDPEIPAISIWDLGVLTNIELLDEKLLISITPTYSGCPAMDVIKEDIHFALTQANHNNFSIKLVLTPAWSTDLMSPEGKNKLRQYGIAPPQSTQHCSDSCSKIACPHCGSINTQTISEFGSTACKALHKCLDCQEPFDYFKNI